MLGGIDEAGSYLRLIDFCITQLKAQGPSRTCNESTEEGESLTGGVEPFLRENLSGVQRGLEMKELPRFGMEDLQGLVVFRGFLLVFGVSMGWEANPRP